MIETQATLVLQEVPSSSREPQVADVVLPAFWAETALPALREVHLPKLQNFLAHDLPPLMFTSAFTLQVPVEIDLLS